MVRVGFLNRKFKVVKKSGAFTGSYKVAQIQGINNGKAQNVANWEEYGFVGRVIKLEK